MKFRLPPLNTLRLFEAAGRHLNFKTAAQELGITPSAVSHGIQALEDWLGSALFHRNGRVITLTAAGKDYLPEVAEALGLLAIAADHGASNKPLVDDDIATPLYIAAVSIKVDNLATLKLSHAALSGCVRLSSGLPTVTRMGRDPVGARSRGDLAAR